MLLPATLDLSACDFNKCFYCYCIQVYPQCDITSQHTWMQQMIRLTRQQSQPKAVSWESSSSVWQKLKAERISSSVPSPRYPPLKLPKAFHSTPALWSPGQKNLSGDRTMPRFSFTVFIILCCPTLCRWPCQDCTGPRPAHLKHPALARHGSKSGRRGDRFNEQFVDMFINVFGDQGDWRETPQY